MYIESCLYALKRSQQQKASLQKSSSHFEAFCPAGNYKSFIIISIFFCAEAFIDFYL